MKQYRVKTVLTTEEGEYFSVFPEDLGIDPVGMLYVDYHAPALPSEQEAVELLNLGDDIVLVDDFDPTWVPLVARGDNFNGHQMWPIYIEGDGDEDEDEEDAGPLPLEIDDG